MSVQTMHEDYASLIAVLSRFCTTAQQKRVLKGLADGSVEFAFQEVTKADVPDAVSKSYEDKFIESCFSANYDDKQHPRPPSCSEK